MSVTLRPYQIDAVNKMRNLMKNGCHSILYQGATGSGKTALTSHMLKTAASKNMRSLFICHRRELILQTTRAFALEGAKHGIIAAGFDAYTRPLVQIASIQTLTRRINRVSQPSLIVWDECHHIASSSWGSVYRAFPSAYHIGLTATPQRLDGKGIGSYFKEMICGPSVQSLITDGYLSSYRLYAPTTVKTDDLHIRMGDFITSEMAHTMDKPSITGDAVKHYRKYADGKRALIFCASIQHSQHVADRFKAEGYDAEHVDGETPTVQRDDAMRRFRDGSLRILTSVDIFGEGVDVPSLECVVLLRPTTSLGLHLQQVGRALRPAPGKKEAIILDHVGNTMRHGLPDEERTWSLEGHDQRKAQADSEGKSVRTCGSCFACMPADAIVCRFCGWVFPVKPRKVEEKEGELSEVDIDSLRRQARAQQGQAQSLEELTRIGIERRYKFPRRWAYYVFKSRLAKKLGRVA